MSAAIYAPDAKARATIAAAFIRRNPRSVSRAFSACFEMGDGDEVMSHLRTMARRSPTLRANWPRFFSIPLTPAE